jgi:hypothetical protein
MDSAELVARADIELMARKRNRTHTEPIASAPARAGAAH